MSVSDLGTTMPVIKAILPCNFNAPSSITNELQCRSDISMCEYSSNEWLRAFRRVPCQLQDGNKHPWILANPTENWSIIFHSREPIYGTAYWVKYKPEGLLNYLQTHTDTYDLTYLNNGIAVFRIDVIQYLCPQTNKWFVNITTVWLNYKLATAANKLLVDELILGYMPNIFSNHDQCAICYDNAFLEKWRTCNHSLCSDCMKEWRKQNSTCPYCRASWLA